jgi:hypothetical protein
MYKFTKNITCEDPAKCSVDIMSKLETKYGFKIHGKNPEGHISMQHTDSNHQIWIFLYDKAGVFESENMITKQIEKKKSDKTKKFSGTFPTESEIKKII